MNGRSFSVKGLIIRMVNPVHSGVLCRYFMLCAAVLISGNAAGQDYFQQRTDIEIQVRLDDKRHMLMAFERIVYHNRSPQSLSEIWMHLWPNAYKERNTVLSKQLAEMGLTGLYFSKPDERGYIDSLDFKVNGFPVKYIPDSLHQDIIRLILPDPLAPGDSVVITTPFRVKIPDASFSRLGHRGQHYLITQWFPKPAVYDRDGWHPMPYLHMGEFYSEYGSYKVSITIPENYVVAATGILQDEKEKEWLMQKAKETAAQKTEADSMRVPRSSQNLKTITFFQDSIHDFAFFADKRFLVMTDTLKLSESGKVVECFSFFTPKNADRYRNSLKYIKKAVQFYSDRVGDYPYGSVTVVDGLDNAGTDMEYQMITVLGSPASDFMLENLIVHEVGHNWFYGILGSNERDHAWMDEGINTALELWYMDHHGLGPGKNDLYYLPGPVAAVTGASKMDMARVSMLRYRVAAALRQEQAAEQTSAVFTTDNYGAIVYYKTGLLFNFLRTYTGDSLFTACMRDYYNQWSFKHPSPTDLKSIFEQRSGLDLGWLFNGYLNSTDVSDSRPWISKKDKKVMISEKGEINPPIPYTLYKDDSILFNGFGFADTTLISNPEAEKVITGSRYYPEVETANNSSRTYGMFRNLSQIRFRMWPWLEETDGVNTISVIPVPAYNTSNGIMAGAAFSNITLVPKKLEYQLTPLYDFDHGTWAGTGHVTYDMYPASGVFSKITLGVSGKRFGLQKDVTFPNFPSQKYELLSYSKAEPSVAVQFRKRFPRSTFTHGFMFRSSVIWQDEIVYNLSGTDYIPSKETAQLLFNEIRYQIENKRTVDPLSGFINLEQAENHIKASLEFNYTLSYARYGKGVRTRFFAGYFPENDETERNYNFRMSGWDGSDDYKYDHYYFGRNEPDGIWSRQFFVRDGGFITPTAVGQTNEWLAAVNIHADLPFPLPVKVFFNAGTYQGIKEVYPDIANTFMYDGGLCISAGYDLFEVYFPLFYSKDIETNLDANDIGFSETIRFVLNINRVSLKNVRDKLLKWI